MDWYVVNTFSGYENSVKRNLEERVKSSAWVSAFGEIVVPSDPNNALLQKPGGKPGKKFFPGYIFVFMDLNQETWHLVRNTPRVTGFLGGKTPRPVRESEVHKMLGRGDIEEASSSDTSAPVVVMDAHYRVGDMIRIRGGAFANFTGAVEEVNPDKHKLWVSVSIFGRPTRVEVDFTEVEPAA